MKPFAVGGPSRKAKTGPFPSSQLFLLAFS
jgi:hypothetical protein